MSLFIARVIDEDALLTADVGSVLLIIRAETEKEATDIALKAAEQELLSEYLRRGQRYDSLSMSITFVDKLLVPSSTNSSVIWWNIERP